MQQWIKLTILALIVITAGSLAADGRKVFKRKCGTCHSLQHGGEKLGTGTTGPVLSGIASRRPEEYVKLYMKTPDEARKKFADLYDAEVKGKYSMKMGKIQLTDMEINEVYEILK